MIQQKRKSLWVFKERKGVIVKVKTTFRGTKTLLVASTERKYNWKGVTCYSSLLPQNKKEKQPICHCVAFVTYHTNHQQPKYNSQWGKGVISQISPAIPSLTSKYLREIIYLAWHCTAMIHQHLTILLQLNSSSNIKHFFSVWRCYEESKALDIFHKSPHC